LTRVLGETTCKACGATVDSEIPADNWPSGAPGLADEVADALQRAFQRPDQD
jgi:hypothetical protein